MNITYLREFIEVGLNLNLSKAAKNLHVSQPSLSKHIAALEQECKAPLLKRSTSHVQLTPAGQTLFEEAFKLIRLHDETLAKIAALKDVTVLNVGGLCRNAVAISLINRALARLNAEQATVSVAYQDYRHRPYGELLLSGKIDVAFAILGEHAALEEGLVSTPLFRDPMICLAKEGHPFAARGTIHVEELASQVILQPVGSYSSEHGRTTVKEIFARHGISPVEQPVFVHSISELSTVANEDAVLIMERSMLGTQAFTDDYRVVGFYEDDAAFAFHAVWRENTGSPVLAPFVRELARLAQEDSAPEGAGAGA